MIARKSSAKEVRGVAHERVILALVVEDLEILPPDIRTFYAELGRNVTWACSRIKR